MSSQMNLKKGIGVYNSTNPMINKESSKEINTILSTALNERTDEIKTQICGLVSEKVESRIVQNYLRLNEMRNQMNDMYNMFIANVDIDQLNKVLDEQIESFQSNFFSVQNNVKSYHTEVISLKQDPRKEGYDLDSAINQVDQLISLFNQTRMKSPSDDVVMVESQAIQKETEKLKSHELRFEKVNEEINGEEMMNQCQGIINKAEECVQVAKEKIKDTPSFKNNPKRIDISSIKQFKRSRNCCKSQVLNQEVTIDTTPITKYLNFHDGNTNSNQNTLKSLNPVNIVQPSSPKSNAQSVESNQKQSTPSKQLCISPFVLYPDLFVNNKTIYIDEFGLKSAPSDKKSKFTFFGIDPNPDLNEHQNDIVLNLEMSKYSNINAENSKSTSAFNKQCPLFYIYYENKINKYLLKSLTKEIFFSLIIHPYKQINLDISRKNYFKIGKVVISIQIKKEIRNINVKVHKGDTIQETHTYSFFEDKFPISIGRGNCSVVVKCDSVSKTHVTVDYDSTNERYFLIDNGSTNGTQMILSEGKIITLESDMTFNIGPKQFVIEEMNV